MKTSALVWVGIGLVVAVGGWVWWSGTRTAVAPSVQTQTGTQATLPTAAEKTASNTVLNVGTDPTQGQYLATMIGMTLYTYSKDTPEVSNCAGACAANWPPYLVEPDISLSVATGINGAVTTITRADGTTQVTYKGMPLYLWVRDAKAGDVTGNNVEGFLLAKP